MNFIIGDIHGEYNKLAQLIKFIVKNDSNPKLIFIGDYLDKGEDVIETLDYLLFLKETYECYFLWGNHEYLWYNLSNDEKTISNYLLKYGGLSTINSFKKKNIMSTYDVLVSKYEGFFNCLKPYWQNDKYVFTHSGIPPLLYDTPVSEISLKELLFNRYEFVNQNKLFNNKYKVIFGHTGFFSPYIDAFKIGIDTGACYIKSQPLTSFCIENNTFYDSTYSIKSLSDFEFNQCPNIIRLKS